MSNTLGIGIKVDPGDAAAKAKSVQDALAGAEDQGKRTQKAYDALGETFKRIADYQRLVAAESASLKQAGDRIVQSWKGVADAMRAEALNGTAKAFAGVVEQLQREATMLEKIHGPAKQLQQDLQTLEMLYKHGSISAADYTAQLERMGQVHGPDKGQAGSAHSNEFLDSLKGNIGALAGPAAMAALAMHSVTQELDNYKAREQDVRDATNAILKFHGSIEGASAAMAEQRSISDALGVNIKTTTKAYADVREATDDLGLSSREMANITRNLSADLLVDGGSIEQVSTIMDKLRYSLETGTMGTRELKAVWQQSPEVAESFARSIGKTYPELMRMAKEGKITQSTIETFIKGIGQGHEGLDKYRQRLMDVDHVMSENHESFVAAGLDIIKAKQQYEDLGESGTQAMDRILHATTHNVETLEKMADKVQLIMTAIAVQGRFASDQTLIQNGLKTQAMLDSQKGAWAQYTLQLADARKEFERAGLKGKELNDALASIHPPGWVDYYKQELDAIRQPERDWAGRIAALDGLMKNHNITLEEYNAQLAAVTGHTREIGEGLPRDYAMPANSNLFGGVNVLTGKFERNASSVGGDEQYGAATGPSLEDIYNSQPGFAGPDIGSLGKAKTAVEQYDAALAKHKQEIDEITNAMQPLMTAIERFTETGKFDWKTMINSWISDLEKLGEQQLFKSLFGMGGGGGGLGLLGFASSLGAGMGSGGDSGGPAPEVTSFFGGAHAFGGSGTVPYTGGGQDSVTAMFRLSPGEHYNFTPPGMSPQQANGGGGGPTPVTVHVIDQRDPRALMEGPDFDQAVHRVLLKNPGLVKRLAR